VPACSRPGSDLTKRFPLIVETMASLAHTHASSMERRLSTRADEMIE
jgi:hypothetical protein